MVIRMDNDKDDDDTDDICILEATTNSGVHLKYFKNMVKHIGGFYKKFAFRHLEFERTEAHLDILNRFLEEVLGRKYEFNLNDLSKKESIR